MKFKNITAPVFNTLIVLNKIKSKRSTHRNLIQKVSKPEAGIKAKDQPQILGCPNVSPLIFIKADNARN